LVSVLLFIITPQLVHALPCQLLKKLIIIAILHHLIQLGNKPTLQPANVIQEPGRNSIPLVPPITSSGLHPVPPGEISLEPHVISNAFNQPTGSLSVS
ncbi:hypothetical protein LINGRAHAP2_LOCUS4346, partial [Linum grandiflorum]